MDFEQLRRSTADVDEQHREAMRTIHDDLAEVHFGESDPAAAASRRKFLHRVAAGATIAFGSTLLPVRSLLPVAGAQSETTGPDLPGTPSTLPGVVPEEDTALPTVDLEVLLFAESIELAAQAAYELAVDTRRLQPAPAESALRFGRHHSEHAMALAELAVLQESVDPELVAPNQALVDELAPRIDAATNQAQLIRVLYDIEEGAAATYAFALGVLESREAAGGAGLILPVESQHAVVWGQTLSLPISQWMPAFQSQDGAFEPSAYAG
jgi:hypothetical protein